MSLRSNKLRIGLLLFMMVVTQLGIFVPNTPVVQAADNGLALKPLMGWSSFSMQVYTGNNQILSAASIKAQSDAGGR